ncbi:hypothetical protein GPECTOR_11g33 [Gonium pectorale]|uniref:glutathione transferase n=1 Tax=Gonium pectorale TaxID=33097 RepID=A0A150GPV5_GONPE|nr:hypothetical protein GPECTOR_11g33 [Gonium pectorale]|eukprot:KXZ51896.1 hypothetical protein GPECTOR_11g33 [Gonium pectorale]
MSASHIHRGPEHAVAEEGSFAASTSDLPVLQYYPCRGRAEPIRNMLVLSYVGQPWFEPPLESIRKIQSIMRREFDGYPFRRGRGLSRLPRFIDGAHGEVDLVQSGAILRHLGRTYDLYGKDLVQAGRVDMLLDAAAELRAKLRELVVDAGLAESACVAYGESVLAGEEVLRGSGMQGPGLASLEYPLARQRYSSSGWLVGEAPSLADFAVFDLVDLHLGLFPDLVGGRFPALAAHHAKVAALPGVAEYLASDSRHPAAWAVQWIKGEETHGSAQSGA